MKQKDLAKEYALARLHGRLSGNEFSFCENKVFTEGDIESAFNAGRESVFDSFPKLLFKEVQEGLVAVANLFEKLYHVYKSASVEEPQYTFAFDYEMPIQWYDTLEEAMDAANEDYKKRIKQALGL